MQRTFGVPAALALMAAIVGCADSPVQPVPRAAPMPQATTTTGPGTHLVVFKAGAVPTDFVTKVTALGGTVERELRSVGAATVSGLSDAALATLQSDALVSVDRDGGVHVGGTQVATLRVERVPAGARLDHAGGGLFVPPAEREPVPAGEREVQQGTLEDSNVSSIGALVEMITVQRTYAAVQKVMTTLDSARGMMTSEIGKPV